MSFLYRNAFDGKCIKDGESFIQQVKFTTCVQGILTSLICAQDAIVQYTNLTRKFFNRIFFKRTKKFYLILKNLLSFPNDCLTSTQ